MAIVYKTCTFCQRELEASQNFHPHRASGGYQSSCKQCGAFRATMRSWAKRNGEDTRAMDRWVREACRVQQWSPHDQDWGNPDVRID